MTTANDIQIVNIQLDRSARLKLYGQLTARMEARGMPPGGPEALVGQKAGWPVDEHAQPTLAELTIAAAKLDLKIEIADLNLVSMGDLT